MSKKGFLVIGLGQFGMNVARTLAKLGCDVIAIDKNEEKVQEIADEVTYAVTGDGASAGLLENLGISNLDVAIIAVTNNMESSIMATIQAKEMGVPMVMVKASNEIHKKIALKVGADRVIFPEKEMGERIAKNLAAYNFVDLVELSSEISIIETPVRDEWVGRSLIDIGFREKYSINIIAVKENGMIDVSPEPSKPLNSNQVLVLIGSYKSLKKIGMN